MSSDQDVLERIEGHLADIETALGSIDRSLAVAAEIVRFWAATQTGLDPLKGTDYEEDPQPPPWVNG